LGLWSALEKAYGKPGVAGLYCEFKQAMDTTIPNFGEPNLVVDKLLNHFARIECGGLEISDQLKAMILLAKLPSSMDTLVTMVCQTADISTLKLDKIRVMVSTSWEQSSSLTTRRNTQRQQFAGSSNQAQKLSAVK